MNRLSIAIFLVLLLNGYSTIERCCQKYRCEIDSAPGGLHSCPQQKELGKCNEDWMRGYCCKSCPHSCPDHKCHEPMDTNYLAIDQETKNFIFDGNYVFLNGANMPYYEYGKDFGGAQSDETKERMETILEEIHDSGGNVIRVWIFCEGEHYPTFDDNGNVIKSDPANSLNDDISALLDVAKENNIFVIFTLWNAAVAFKDEGLYGLLIDDTGTKLDSFITTVLKPLVEATKDHVALGAWEIINEPEGSILPQSTQSSKSCTDTGYLQGTGIPFPTSDVALPVEKYQKFINLQASAIKMIEPRLLVTVGAWSEKSSTDRYIDDSMHYYRNLWKDECLRLAGGAYNGILDFYQIHTYQTEGVYNTYAPLSENINSVSWYHVDKPVIIGEFGIKRGGTDKEKKFWKSFAGKKYMSIYRKGFNGALMWGMVDESRCSGCDGADACIAGMKVLAEKSDVDGMVDMNKLTWFDWLWRGLLSLMTGILLFGKVCVVGIGLLCCKKCCKCKCKCKWCRKSDDEDESENDNESVGSNERDGLNEQTEELIVIEDEHVWIGLQDRIKCWKWNCCRDWAPFSWIFVVICCCLSLVTALICVLVVLIQQENELSLLGPDVG